MDTGEGEDPLKSHADRAVVGYLRVQPFYFDLAEVVARIAKQSLDSRGIKIHTVQRVYVERTTGTPNKRQAGQFLRDIKEAIERGDFAAKPDPAAVEALRPPNFADAALGYLRAGGDPKYIGTIIAQTGDHALRDKPLAEIDRHPDHKLFRFAISGHLRDMLKLAMQHAGLSFPRRQGGFHLFCHTYGTSMTHFGGHGPVGASRFGGSLPPRDGVAGGEAGGFVAGEASVTSLARQPQQTLQKIAQGIDMARILYSLSCAIVGLLIASAAPASAQIPTRNVHFWMKAFIANPTGNASTDFTKTDAGRWVLRAPLAGAPVIGHVLPGGCFSIDDRGFSNDPLASARVTFEANLTVTGRDIKVDAFNGRKTVRIGDSHNLDCKTGADLQPSKVASKSSVSIGDVKSSQRGRLLVYNVRASTPNPYYDLGWISAPKIDFELVFTFDVIKQKISILGTTGVFPSFEAYYTINNGSVEKVLNRSPAPDAGPMSLADFGTGINTQNFTAEIPLPLQ